MAKYLDPKADLTFKKVFGEHKGLMSELSENYGCPQWMLSDKDVAIFIDKYADTLSIESIYYSVDKYWDQISREYAAEIRGEAKGRAEERLAIAKTLLGMSMTIEQVSLATNLTIEQIKENM